MRHCALGLLWHAWRLSRRWFLLTLAIALAINLTIMNVAPPGMAGLPDRREYLASGTVLLGTLLALFTTLVAISLGGRAGFPLRFEFRLPVSTSLLVGMPMLMLAVLCASLCAIPLLLDWMLYGLPMPWAAGAALVGTASVLLAAASWSAATNSLRGVTLILAVAGGARLLTWIQPIRVSNGSRSGERPFNPDMLHFSAGQYVLLALLVLLLYGVTVRCVGLQRQSEPWRFRLARSTIRAGSGNPLGALIDRGTDLLRLPCPTSSPWLAELWLESKRLGLPVVLLGLLLALLVPLLPWAQSLLGAQFTRPLITAAPLVLFFTGIGIGIFNRRTASGGYMNPFEGTRALDTLQLAVIQLGALGAALLLGTALIGISLWLSAPLYDDVGPLWSRLANVIHAVKDGNLMQQAGTATTLIAAFFALMTFFFCVHSCSTFWGRKVMYGALGFLVYAVIFAHAALTDENAGAFVAQNMWWFAGITLVSTLLLIARVARLRLLALRSGAIVLAAWLLACTGTCFMLERLDVHLLTQAAELQALNAALLTLPLTLFLWTVWCYDRLRHR